MELTTAPSENHKAKCSLSVVDEDGRSRNTEQKCSKQIEPSKNPVNNGDMEISVSYSMLGGCFLRSYRVSLVAQTEKNLPAMQET